MEYNLEDFEPIFGEAKPTYEGAPSIINGAPKLNPFLFRVFASDPFHLTVHVSDFRSYTWESIRSIHQLDDLRDNIGIGGSWSDFMNYVAASLKSKDVKLVMQWQSNLSGAVSAKLVARKSKGLPLLSVSLSKLVDSAASEAMANMSLELFKAYNVLQESSVTEQDGGSRLTPTVFTEKDKSLTVKRKLDTEMQRFRNTSDIGSTASPLNSDTSSVTAALNNTEKQPATEVQSSKVAHRVVPAFRRAKVRGAVLHDAVEEDDD
ncbi:hypothetical protein RND81_13G211600 [Saponaria officinalis]|uniref:Uncharacterized protein n=1 Tax=Saponaria officinalis TaxID=3572 RepID=A0AAW1H6R2_SAPOF